MPIAQLNSDLQAAGSMATMICVLGVVLVVGTLVGAIILLAACALYNRLAGRAESPNSVPEPDLGSAMGIVFVATLANVAIGVVIGSIFNDGAAAPRGSASIWIPQLISAPAGILVLAGILTAKLPTPFTRALLISLLYLALGLIVGLAIGVFVAIVQVATGGPAGQ